MAWTHNLDDRNALVSGGPSPLHRCVDCGQWCEPLAGRCSACHEVESERSRAAAVAAYAAANTDFASWPTLAEAGVLEYQDATEDGDLVWLPVSDWSEAERARITTGEVGYCKTGLVARVAPFGHGWPVR